MTSKQQVESIFQGAEVRVREADGSSPPRFRWKVTTDRPIQLSALRELERLIGHDYILLRPATYEPDYSELTPGDGFAHGYVEFDWKEGA